MRVHNELTAITVTAEPKDANNVATTPTTVEYRVDDCRTGRQLVNWTSLTPSTVMTIAIPGSVNAIINSARQSPEVKKVTLRIDKDLTTQTYAQYKYGVQDLGFAQVA